MLAGDCETWKGVMGHLEGDGIGCAGRIGKTRSMSDTRRMLRGLSANLAAIGSRIAVQFATVPILFANWSVEAIGIWLILFAVPSYVAIVGNALVGAGGTAALAAVQAGDMDRARQDFRVAWGISAASTAALALVFAGCAMFLIPSLLEAGDEVDLWDAAKAAAWLALYVFATSQMGIFDIPYRAVGRYPDHLFLFNAASLVEIVVLAAAVTFSDSLSTLAMSLALYRCVAALWIYLSAREAAPALFQRGASAAQQSVRELWLPSLAFMLMPLVYGVNLQGYLLLVGAVFGAVALAAFSATRILTRLLDLITGLTFAMQYYESGYIPGNRRAVQRRMLATMTLVSLAISVAFSVTLLVLGNWLQNLFTMGETAFDNSAAMVLLAASSIRALASAPTAIVAADNAHARIASLYLAGSVAGLFLATALGFAGASLTLMLTPLLLAEMAQLVPAMRRAWDTLGMTADEFFAALVSGERLEDVQAMWRMLRARM